eukprot:6521-Pyramimonas_sp.AAC.1
MRCCEVTQVLILRRHAEQRPFLIVAQAFDCQMDRGTEEHQLPKARETPVAVVSYLAKRFEEVRVRVPQRGLTCTPRRSIGQGVLGFSERVRRMDAPASQILGSWG